MAITQKANHTPDELKVPWGIKLVNETLQYMLVTTGCFQQGITIEK